MPSLKKCQTKTAFEIEEERYKLKKRQVKIKDFILVFFCFDAKKRHCSFIKNQRLEREKAEKELAQRFAQQLYLDVNKLASIRLEEEEERVEEEEEDEFPGKENFEIDQLHLN